MEPQDLHQPINGDVINNNQPIITQEELFPQVSQERIQQIEAFADDVAQELMAMDMREQYFFWARATYVLNGNQDLDGLDVLGEMEQTEATVNPAE